MNKNFHKQNKSKNMVRNLAVGGISVWMLLMTLFQAKAQDKTVRPLPLGNDSIKGMLSLIARMNPEQLNAAQNAVSNYAEQANAITWNQDKPAPFGVALSDGQRDHMIKIREYALMLDKYTALTAKLRDYRVGSEAYKNTYAQLAVLYKGLVAANNKVFAVAEGDEISPAINSEMGAQARTCYLSLQQIAAQHEYE